MSTPKLGPMGAAMHPVDFACFDLSIERSMLAAQPQKLPSVMLPASIVAGNVARSAAHFTPGASYRMGRIAMTIAVVNNAALLETPLVVELLLSAIDPDLRPFAAEAVGMGYFSRHVATDGQESLFKAYLGGPGSRFGGLPYTGIGMSAQKLGVPVTDALDAVSGFFRWHVLDGYAFWAGRWSWDRFGATRAPCADIEPYLYPAYDRGLGRSAWFNFGADPRQAADWADGFDGERRQFIWAGIGVASTFAGGCEMADLSALSVRAKETNMSPWLAAGAIHGVATRRWCGCDSAYNRRAVEVLAGRSVEEAASFAKAMRERIDGDGADAYRAWYSLLAGA